MPLDVRFDALRQGVKVFGAFPADCRNVAGGRFAQRLAATATSVGNAPLNGKRLEISFFD